MAESFSGFAPLVPRLRISGEDTEATISSIENAVRARQAGFRLSACEKLELQRKLRYRVRVTGFSDPAVVAQEFRDEQIARLMSSQNMTDFYRSIKIRRDISATTLLDNAAFRGRRDTPSSPFLSNEYYATFLSEQF